MDPFEVRMRFTSLLTHLTATVNAAVKAASFAVKHRDMDEDLHSCILEALEKNNMNNRANVMYFLEQLCDVAVREHANQYVHMIRRDILRIINAVAPIDGSGAANVKVARHVVGALQARGVLTTDLTVELDECLRDRETLPAHPALSPAASDESSSRNMSPHGGRPSASARLDKRQIEQRLEEDRERHKRLRENVWAVDDTKEIDRLWEDMSDIGEQDYLNAEQVAVERRQIITEVAV